MTTTTKTAPTICRFGDDLTGYLDGLIEKSRISKKRLISSISFQTSFSDPLAILEKLHQTNDPHCYFEKATDDFAIACGRYLAHYQCNGPHRFQLAKEWSAKLFQSVDRAGDAPIAGSGPTIFLTASFEAEFTDHSQPSLTVFFARMAGNSKRWRAYHHPQHANQS